MFTKKETGLARQAVARDPFALLRQMTSDFDRMFEGTTWPAFRWPALRATTAGEGGGWFPGDRRVREGQRARHEDRSAGDEERGHQGRDRRRTI